MLQKLAKFQRVNGKDAWSQYGDLIAARAVAGSGQRFDSDTRTEGPVSMTSAERACAELLSLDYEFPLGRRLELVIHQIPETPRKVASLHFCNGIVLPVLARALPQLAISKEIKLAEQLAAELLNK